MEVKSMDKIQLGSISTGTLLTGVLLGAFMSEAESRGLLEDTDKLKIAYDSIFAEIQEDAVIEAFENSEYASYAVNETLPDLLNEDLPPFIYFGANEGDGADFGYWFDNDSFEQAVQDKECLKVNDLSEIPDTEKDEYEYYAVVSDHGNVTLYNYKLEELYGVV
jgi:hypothetical protein